MSIDSDARRLADPALDAVRAAVQANCDIADARHAGDYTLCVYLLKMREYFRWEHALAFDAPLPKEALTDWLSAREARWDALAQSPFAPLPLNPQGMDAFDTEGVNQRLAAHGLVYSGGLGVRGRPHFFLARLAERREQDGHSVLIAAEEYARDLAAPPAMTLGRTVFVRRESLQRMIWERYEEWRWNRPDTPMGRALGEHDFERRPAQALAAMTEQQIDTLLWHELGELAAGEQLGETWNEMLAAAAGTPTELFGRAVRDHLADCLVTLPALLEAPAPGPLHFFIGNLGGMRKHIFPALREAYDAWTQQGSTQALREISARGAAHWRAVGEELLNAYARAPGGKALPPLEALIDQRRL